MSTTIYVLFIMLLFAFIGAHITIRNKRKEKLIYKPSIESWKQDKNIQGSSYHFHTDKWMNSDGDYAHFCIYDDNAYMRLHCFSGVTASFITVHKIDLRDFLNMADKKMDVNNFGDEVVAYMYIADYFCHIFCKEVGDD
jgi:predicted Co/Zn/Cd cation transporter (cation efflux family)